MEILKQRKARLIILRSDNYEKDKMQFTKE